ncbi:bifunctional pantoate--beta-alanine ligase/(d)CMP kinase [Chroococcus sp. FPU101]|uniref:bifunctional pantoate--beta-alanine ligase/(d)CMP kinase n=1 Tax=Chroococcus sp. FPU101 TaxID=1974212 RepID=UPI001A8FFB1F|nr:bifunctional pantoate--beta-alanine ligase/(d)CMP kinase [Chroococcus sp. FPU101]GFE71972.1 pantoate/beta-alanine ligase [Chroococcus sp. FPU101]
MRLFTTIAGLRSYLNSHGKDKTIGLVPTMGALHIGHASIIKRAIAENQITIVSIFINPLQFAPTEDLEKYPRQHSQDYQLCEKLGVNVIFAPTPATMGIEPNHSLTTVVPPKQMTSVLCGVYRPGHFQGVATIVTKLLTIVNPTVAYFGEKDAQQLVILRQLVDDLNLKTEIRSCPTVREPSGLAYSSRNQYLTPTEKEQAAILYQSLKLAIQSFEQGVRDSKTLITEVQQQLNTVQDLNIQYVELVDPTTLTPLEKITESGLLAIAVYLGSTRLIDNVILRQRKPIIAIDGPAGVGKSTVTRCVAQALGLTYLDSGAMYRALTWLVMQKGIPLDDEAAIAEIVSGVHLELLPSSSPSQPMTIKINGEDVTEAIRTPEVTQNVSVVSAQSYVRQVMLEQQQQYGKIGGIVIEGRDIGTKVFPDAELKIFLTASVQERARRRSKDLIEQGQTHIGVEQLEQDIQKRDYLDSHRSISPLLKAPDAIAVNTDGLTIKEVTDKIIQLYQERMFLS